MANLGDLDQIREMEVELEDRFGSLPELARNLMLQLRFKVLAREAGVQSVLVESDHLVLRADWLEKAGRAQIRVRLGDLAYIGRRELRLPLGGAWQERLQAVLAALRRERSG